GGGAGTATSAAPTAGVDPLAFSADGKTLAPGSLDGTIKLWDVADGKEKATLRGHAGNVAAVAFAADGKTLVSAGQDGSTRLWDLAAKKEPAALRGHAGPVESARPPPAGQRVPP